jgi:Fur family transcriptional regulator, ferric uptake regulator
VTEPSRDWTAELRSRGYRLTPQRQLVLEAVRELDHSTPDAIAAAVKQRSPAVNVSTVYRTLDLLEELGLVTHTHLGHGAPTYHAADASDHVHLVCHQCGHVIAVERGVVAALAGTLRDQHGFEMDMSHCVVHGTCASCGGR